MLTRSEKLTLIARAFILIVYIIGITLNCMFREMKQKALTSLRNLRLFKQAPDDSSTAANVNSITGHIFAVGGAPSLTPIPNEVLTAAIGRSLPIIRYGDLLANCGDDGGEDTIEEGCAVCWESVQRSDEIRDLPNCGHVFHRDCLDNWVENGQITCPLCRSNLLPPLINPWAVILQSNSSASLINSYPSSS